MTEISRILKELEDGEPQASAELLSLLYDELRKLAAAKLTREQPGHTLQATALVHEAYLRLVDADDSKKWAGRAHFFAAAAEAMRRILVETARRKKRAKHGGQWQRAELDPVEIPCVMPDDELLALDDALRKLQESDPIKARLIDLRFFAGLTNEQAADALGMSPATAKRHWRYTRALLRSEVRPGEPPAD